MSAAAALLSRYPITVPGWHVTQAGVLKAYLSKVAPPGPNGAPRDPWGRPFEGGALVPVEMANEVVEFRGMIRMRGNPVEVQLINA